MMRRQRSVWAKIASPLMIAPSMGSVLSKVRAAVISLASGATRNCPMTPCSRSLNAASRCTPGTSPTALPRSRLPSIATCPAAGHGDGPRTKNGPALAGHGAEAVRDAITRAITTLPEQLRRSLTWDQGAEMAEPAELRIEAGVAVYFCDPHSPWQRGTNENTNGLLRQYFPKGTDLSVHSAEDLAAVAIALNSRPRKTLGWRTPAEALDQFLRSTHIGRVATTT